MLLLELQVLLVESVHSIDHGLNELNLGVAQSVLVGDVVGDAGLSARFSTGSTGLEVQGFTSLLQGRESFLGPSGKVNMNRGAHAGSKVGRAGVEESKARVEHEFAARFGPDGISDSLDAADETVENTADIST